MWDGKPGQGRQVCTCMHGHAHTAPDMHVEGLGPRLDTLLGDHKLGAAGGGHHNGQLQLSRCMSASQQRRSQAAGASTEGQATPRPARPGRPPPSCVPAASCPSAHPLSCHAAPLWAPARRAQAGLLCCQGAGQGLPELGAEGGAHPQARVVLPVTGVQPIAAPAPVQAQVMAIPHLGADHVGVPKISKAVRAPAQRAYYSDLVGQVPGAPAAVSAQFACLLAALCSASLGMAGGHTLSHARR